MRRIDQILASDEDELDDLESVLEDSDFEEFEEDEDFEAEADEDLDEDESDEEDEDEEDELDEEELEDLEAELEDLEDEAEAAVASAEDEVDGEDEYDVDEEALEESFDEMEDEVEAALASVEDEVDADEDEEDESEEDEDLTEEDLEELAGMSDEELDAALDEMEADGEFEEDEDSDEEDEDEEDLDEEELEDLESEFEDADWDEEVESALASAEEEVDAEDEADANEDCDAEEDEEFDLEEEDEDEGFEAEALVADLDHLESEGVSAADVEMRLYAGESENPYWNITVASEPVGRIYLQDQENPERVRKLFVSTAYSQTTASAIANHGLKAVLGSAKCKLFVAKAQESELAIATEEKVRAEVTANYEEAMAGVTDKFSSALSVALAGSNKNFFAGDNKLKGGIFEALTEVGASEQDALALTERVIAKYAPAFFDSMIVKAEELMGLDESAFQAIASSVEAAGLIAPVVASEKKETMSQRMEQATASVKPAVDLFQATAQTQTQPRKLFGK